MTHDASIVAQNRSAVFRGVLSSRRKRGDDGRHRRGVSVQRTIDVDRVSPLSSRPFAAPSSPILRVLLTRERVSRSRVTKWISIKLRNAFRSERAEKDACLCRYFYRRLYSRDLSAPCATLDARERMYVHSHAATCRAGWDGRFMIGCDRKKNPLRKLIFQHRKWYFVHNCCGNNNFRVIIFCIENLISIKNRMPSWHFVLFTNLVKEITILNFDS